MLRFHVDCWPRSCLSLNFFYQARRLFSCGPYGIDEDPGKVGNISFHGSNSGPCSMKELNKSNSYSPTHKKYIFNLR